MMKIAFITSIVYPSPTANRIHTLSMARAFARKGVEVDLLCQSIVQVNLPSSVKKVELGTSKSISSAWKYSAFLKQQKHDAWFVREPHLMLFTIIFFFLRSFKNPPFILYEVHDMPRDFFDTLSLKLLRIFKRHKIITITHLLKEDLVSTYKLNPNLVMVLPDGVDLDIFADSEIKNNPYDTFKDIKKPLVVYTGSLFSWKGIYTLIDAAKVAPDINFWIVGGYEKDIEQTREISGGLANVKIWGYKPHGDIRNFLQLADVLVLPNSATYRMSERYTSPLKLFEYMASGKPIVASKLPSIQEIIHNEETGYLVEPDDPEALLGGIKKALHADGSNQVTENAKKEVVNYTWDRRVEKIIVAIA